MCSRHRECHIQETKDERRRELSQKLPVTLVGWSVRGGGETGRSQTRYVKEFGFYPEGAGEPWKGIEQKILEWSEQMCNMEGGLEAPGQGRR